MTRTIAGKAENGIELLRDAEDYVQSLLSSQITAILGTLIPNGTGRKRQLSMPDESVIKQSKNGGRR